MKSFSKYAVLVVGLALAVACAKKEAAKKIIPAEDVGKSLAASLCEKYTGCQPSPDFNKDQCLQEITTGLTERLKSKTDLKIEQATLDACAKSIASAGCEVLNSETPPSGCEFLN